jgi:hypothetical protein
MVWASGSLDSKQPKSCAGYLWPDAPDRVQEAFRKNEPQELESLSRRPDTSE